MALRHEHERPVPLPSHWVVVNGLRMHYRAAGTGSRAVVLVHGLTVSGNYLLPTAAKLLANFTVYVPDFPGFGASEKPRRVQDMADLAETLKAWMDAIGLEQAYLLGNSMGCHVIAIMAALHREHVAGTIFVSPVGHPGRRNTLWLVMRALNDFVREPRSLWAIMFRDFLKAGGRRTVLTLNHMQECPLEVWLPQVHIPSLVVRGGRDRIVPERWIERVVALLPQGRGAVIGDAGHVPNFSHPARLTALVRAFVENSDGWWK